MTEREQYAYQEAPEGKIWRCPICGRKSRNRYVSTEGCNWDESCGMHAVLVDDVPVKI